jgi:hypothetical protein
MEPQWLAERVEDDEVWFRIGRVDNLLIAEWPGLCTLTADRDGSNAKLVAAPGAAPVTLEKVQRGVAYALVESLRGKVSLHAGAVARNGGAIVLVGRNHAGKSSAVADLCAHGAQLLADDIAVIARGHDGSRLVEPTERHHWLGPASRVALGLGTGGNSEDDKHPLLAAEPGASPVRLRAIIAIEFEEGDPHLTRVAGIEAMSRLVPSVVRFALDDGARSREELGQLVQLLDTVPFYLLRRPRDLARIREPGMLMEELLK